MTNRAHHQERTEAVLTVERGMQVLRAFRAERGAMTNAKLVSRTGLSKATVSRLTTTLLQLGHLRRVAGERGFELGEGSLGIGHAFLQTSEVVSIAQPFVQRLAECVGGSAALAVPDGEDMTYIAYGASYQVATLRLGIGSVLPMGLTAIGRAYLWALPADQRLHTLERLRQHAGEQVAALDGGIAEAFADLDARGVCCVAAGVLRDTFGLALPVKIGRRGVQMAISCGKAMVNPDLTLERARMEPLLKQAAIEIEQLLANVDGIP